MASPARSRAKHTAAAPSPIGLLTDDLLAEILLRLPTLADVGRAAASCADFRRVAAGRAFLRRLRSVHPAPLLGLLRHVIHPAELPHSSAPYAHSFAGGADLSFSFLPPVRWFPLDARDGRVLLELDEKSPPFTYVVCDPLSRGYALLPQIPGDPASNRHWIMPFLVPASDGEAETSFRVVCALNRRRHDSGPVAFVFSSATGQWSSLTIGADVRLFRSRVLFRARGFAYGCFYWKLDETDNLIVFDTRSMEFSLVHFPLSQDQWQQDLVIVEAGGGRLGMFTLDNSVISAMSHLVYAIQKIDEDGSSSWRIERRVRLPTQNFFSLEDATDRYLLLSESPWGIEDELLSSTVDGVETGYFSVEFESMRIEKMYAKRFRNEMFSKLYSGFPPSLCLPSV